MTDEPRRIRPKKCKVCPTKFIPRTSLQRVCSLECSIILVNEEKAKKQRKATVEKKVSLRSKRDWLKLAQIAFNAYIRKRDEHLPCICCGKTVQGKYGGSWDAGHYLSRGAYPELRFNEDNCHKQLKTCNAGAGKFAHKQKTVNQGYREGLIRKIGLERVEALEGPHPPAKWTIEELKEICETYKAKLKALTKTDGQKMEAR